MLEEQEAVLLAQSVLQQEDRVFDPDHYAPALLVKHLALRCLRLLGSLPQVFASTMSVAMLPAAAGIVRVLITQTIK